MASSREATEEDIKVFLFSLFSVLPSLPSSFGYHNSPYPQNMGFKDDGVPSLVQAVKEHRKFRQLACYSIECVAKVREKWHKSCGNCP